MRLLTPKLDFVFKKLFTSDTGVLTDILNSVLKLSGRRRIRSVRVKNPVTLPEKITRKYHSIFWITTSFLITEVFISASK